MSDTPASKPTFIPAGIDVSADWLDAAREVTDGLVEHHRFANTAAGHAALCRWLTDADREARVAVESSGAYSFDLALALHEAPGIEVMLLNPRGSKDYRRAHMRRSKTDTVDAAVLCDYVRRMPFTAWAPPEPAVVELRAVARRIADLTVERTRELCRLHAARASRTASPVVVNDIEVNLCHPGAGGSASSSARDSRSSTATSD